MSTICLCAIVQNDATYIIRFLKSILRQTPISYWIIWDLGSKDNTCDVIEEFFRDRAIPGYLITEKGNSNAEMLNRLLHEAADKTSYTLIMHYQFVGSIHLPTVLTADVYAIEQKFQVPVPCAQRYYTDSLYSNAVEWHFAYKDNKMITVCSKDTYTRVFLEGQGGLYVA